MNNLGEILDVSYSSFKDTRDGRVYKTVKLGEYEWFQENLDFAPENLYGKRAMDLFGIDKPYMDFDLPFGGKHYEFLSTKWACPEGWEVPSRKVFIDLFSKITGKPPHEWRDKERNEISSALYREGSFLKLDYGGKYDYAPQFFSKQRRKEYMDEALGWYWSSTPGAMSNGGSAFCFTDTTYIEDVIYGFCMVRPVRKIYTVMEIKRFNQFLNEMKKGYGEDYSLNDVRRGEVVAYRGTRYFVIDSNEFMLELSKDRDAAPGDRKNLLANKSMFREYGAIPDQN